MSRFSARELSFGAMYALNNYIRNTQRTKNKNDRWLVLLSSLYCFHADFVNSYLPKDIDTRVREILKDYIVEDMDTIFLELMEEGEEEIIREYSSVIEYCCDMYWKEVANKKSAIISEPRELSIFIGKLMHFYDIESESNNLYIPFAGIGSTAIECYCPNTDCEDINPIAWAISMIRLNQDYIKGDMQNHNWNIRQADSFITLVSKGKQYESIVFNPPFGLRTIEGYDEFDALEMAFENKLAENGQLCCVLRSNFLVSNKPKILKLRNFLLENGHINTIISLPKIFSPYTEVSSIVLILEKFRTNNTVRLINGTDFITSGLKGNGGGTFDYQRLLSAIYDKDPNFVVEKTVSELLDSPNLITPASALLSSQSLNNDEKLYRLRDLVKITSKRATLQNLESDFPLPKYVIGNLFDTPYNCEIQLTAAPMDNQLYYTPLAGINHFVFVDAPSFVVQFFNKSAKVAKITNEGNILVQAKRNSFFFKVDETIILSEYLLKCLQSERVLSQTAVYQNFIYEKNFLNLLVVVPSLEQQKEELMKSLASNVDSLNSLVNKSFETYKQEIHTRKHALSQNISALSSYWNKINNIRTKNNDIIDGSKFVGIVNPVPVSSILDSISNLISTIEKQVEHIADVNYDWGQSVEIKPQQFISNFIRKNATPEFLMTLSNRIEHKTKMFYAPLQAVERVFTNIVTNAKEHGFTDLARNDYEIAFDWFEENGNIVILISNNGNPLKDGVTEDMVFTYGFSTMFNVNGHNGIGGSETKSIMKKMGDIEIISNPDERFPVTYKLTFKNTNF